MSAWLFALFQLALFVVLAPLFAAWIKQVKCWMQNRQPPSLWQPYRDLRRLFGKQVLLSENASPLFRITPYILATTTLLAAFVVPLISLPMPTTVIADMIVLAGFFALGRFFLALAAMDIGTAFGGMGASREMTLAALAEPAMLMAIFTLAMVVSSTNLSTVMQYMLTHNMVLRPSLLFALLSMILVAIAETGRIPVDNPATHLELTMIHEAMILEYSGRQLALIEWAAQLKMLIFAVLLLNVFFPWGMSTELTFVSLLFSLAALLFKLFILGALLAISESVMAKMRLFKVSTFLGLALILALIGMLSHIILEIN